MVGIQLQLVQAARKHREPAGHRQHQRLLLLLVFTAGNFVESNLFVVEVIIALQLVVPFSSSFQTCNIPAPLGVALAVPFSHCGATAVNLIVKQE